MQWELIDLIGFIGAGLLLYAFWRNASGTWQSTSLMYALCNLFAAFILTGYSLYKGAYANVALNVVWFIVAIVSIRNYRELKRKDIGIKKTSRKK